MLFQKAKITIGNEFHGTEKTLWARIPAGSDAVLITRGQAKACKEWLCGLRECNCGDGVGARPGVCAGINPNSDGLVEVFVKPEKIMDSFYESEWPDGTGKLIKQ